MTHQKIIFTFIYFEHLLQSTFFKITTLQREWKECTNLKLEKVLTGKESNKSKFQFHEINPDLSRRDQMEVISNKCKMLGPKKAYP